LEVIFGRNGEISGRIWGLVTAVYLKVVFEEEKYSFRTFEKKKKINEIDV